MAKLKARLISEADFLAADLPTFRALLIGLIEYQFKATEVQAGSLIIGYENGDLMVRVNMQTALPRIVPWARYEELLRSGN